MTAVASPPSRRRVILAALALAAVAAGGWFAWAKWSASRAQTVEYVFATVQRTHFEDLVSATGALQPRDYVDVGAQVSGQLKKLHVEVGNDVTEGQLLAEIDAEQSAARVDASRASLRALQAQLAQSQVNLQKAERDLQRQRNLLKEDATTLELVQNAETTADAARAQITTQKAQIEQTQASMRVEESNLKYTKIYAPMAGTVVSITAKQGQTLNTNQAAPTILRVADQSSMTVQTQVSEADVGRLRVGMPAYFTTLGSPGRRWHGKLRKIEPTPTVTNNVVLYNALFDVENHNRSLMAQMTAQVFFVVAEARDALVVPMSAVTFRRRDGAAGPASTASAAASAPALAASGAPGCPGW
ncbi:MAG: efflux RND transporter periplasmic adaptor subunit [Acidovorax sp.]|uniref:efflux RND transporter periplasmic adaptor subunit n=1 Tax=Acidovorax sp. TaxID=1872122 RepID=UPI0039E6261E